MDNFSFGQIKRKVQEIVKEYLSEEFLKSLETSDEFIPDLEYAQTISDSVIDIEENMPVCFFYQVRTDNIKALELLFATYHKVLKNVKVKITLEHSLNQKVLFEETSVFTIEDNSWVQFYISNGSIPRNTPLTITLTILEKGNNKLSLWYGRNVNIYGGFFRSGDEKIFGYPALRIYTSEQPQSTPSIVFSEPNVEFLEKIRDIGGKTQKEQKQIVTEYESLFRSLLKENKELEKQVEILQQEKDVLYNQVCDSSIERSALLSNTTRKTQSNQTETEELLKRIARNELETFHKFWDKGLRRNLFLLKYRWFLRKKSGEFPIIDLTAGKELEQQLSFTSPTDRICLYWGTHDRINKGAIRLGLYDADGQILKQEELRMEDIPNLEPSPFCHSFSAGTPYFLKISCPDGLPGNCIAPLGTHKTSKYLPPIQLNGYKLPAVLKIGME